MGRVKDLLINEQEKRFEARVHYLMKEEGLTEDQARELACDEEAAREEAKDAHRD